MGENGRRGSGGGATFIDKRAARRASEARMEGGGRGYTQCWQSPAADPAGAWLPRSGVGTLGRPEVLGAAEAGVRSGAGSKIVSRKCTNTHARTHTTVVEGKQGAQWRSRFQSVISSRWTQCAHICPVLTSVSLSIEWAELSSLVFNEGSFQWKHFIIVSSTY